MDSPDCWKAKMQQKAISSIYSLSPNKDNYWNKMSSRSKGFFFLYRAILSKLINLHSYSNMLLLLFKQGMTVFMIVVHSTSEDMSCPSQQWHPQCKMTLRLLHPSMTGTFLFPFYIFQKWERFSPFHLLLEAATVFPKQTNLLILHSFPLAISYICHNMGS